MASTSSQSRLPGRNALPGRKNTTTNHPSGDKPGLIIEERKHLGKLNIRGDSAILAGITAQTGCKALPENNRFVTVGDRHLVWLGPDEYLLLCEAGREEDILGRLLLDFDSIHAAATNVTDSLCALDIRGSAVRQVLAKGCTLDLHPRVFATGQCAQTYLSHAAVTLLATDANRFLLFCRVSFASYVVDWLEDAGLEFGTSFRA